VIVEDDEGVEIYIEDEDSFEGQTEPDCGGCWDSGIMRPANWWEGPFPRVRAGRGRCVDCNPSPRQRRRWPKHLIRIEQAGETYRRRFAVEVTAGRAAYGERPF
jgi:hypothetical protein